MKKGREHRWFCYMVLYSRYVIVVSKVLQFPDNCQHTNKECQKRIEWGRNNGDGRSIGCPRHDTRLLPHNTSPDSTNPLKKGRNVFCAFVAEISPARRKLRLPQVVTIVHPTKAPRSARSAEKVAATFERFVPKTLGCREVPKWGLCSGNRLVSIAALLFVTCKGRAEIMRAIFSNNVSRT